MNRFVNELPPSERRALQAAFLTDPPPMLRERILAHSRVPESVRLAPLVAVMLAITLLLWPTFRPQPTSDAEVALAAINWHARSAELEQVWQRIGDRDWLLGDVRAAPISRRLRLLDERLSAQVDSSSSGDHLNALWRERSETLAELVLLRQQGGYAIRL